MHRNQVGKGTQLKFWLDKRARGTYTPMREDQKELNKKRKEKK